MAYPYHDDADAFFKTPDGERLGLLFSKKAAKEIIERAASEGLMILRYEGGTYLRENGGFRASLSAIWDRYRYHYTRETLEIGNLRAVAPFDEWPEEIDVFFITAAPASDRYKDLP